MIETSDTDSVVAEGDEFWSLRLYVAGQSPKSLRAFANLKKLCEEHLTGCYEIEIIDVVEDPSLAQGDDIVAIPTLVRRLPEPLRKIIGDLSNTERVLISLKPASARAKLDGPTIVALPAADEGFTELTLFVSGATDLAGLAVTNARRLCDAHLGGRYHLSVVDVNQDVAALVAYDVLATPTLVKTWPLPVRKVIGDLSQADKVLRALGLAAAHDTASRIGS